jgi:hypothetical protein
MMMALGLVITTVIGVGLFIHWIWPDLPIGAAPSRIVIAPFGKTFPLVIACTATASVGQRMAAIDS